MGGIHCWEAMTAGHPSPRAVDRPVTQASENPQRARKRDLHRTRGFPRGCGMSNNLSSRRVRMGFGHGLAHSSGATPSWMAAVDGWDLHDCPASLRRKNPCPAQFSAIAVAAASEWGRDFGVSAGFRQRINQMRLGRHRSNPWRYQLHPQPSTPSTASSLRHQETKRHHSPSPRSQIRSADPSHTEYLAKPSSERREVECHILIDRPQHSQSLLSPSLFGRVWPRLSRSAENLTILPGTR